MRRFLAYSFATAMLLSASLSFGKTFEEYCLDKDLPADQREFVIAVKKAYKTTDCAVPQQEIDRSKSLSLGNDAIVSSIKPIDGFKNLEQVFISKSHVRDLSPLAKLKSLKSVDMYDALIEDVSPLAGLTNLERLGLRGNRIKDISPLKGLSKLKMLAIRNNEITDFSVLANLTNLEQLYVGYRTWSDDGGCAYPRITSTGFKESLKKLTNLKILRASYLDISNTSDIEKLTKLNYLSLDCNLIRTTQVLNALPNLYGLSMVFNGISTIRLEKVHENLRALNLQGNNISDVTFLKNTPKLASLNVSINEIYDASPIVNLSKLDQLKASRNRIYDASFLDNLAEIESVYLEDNAIAKFPYAPKASILMLTNNNLSDIEGVERMPKLRELGVANNPIKDLSPFSKIEPKGRLSLDISSTDVTDLSPLAGFTVVNLKLDNSNFSALSQIPDFPELYKLSMNSTNVSSIDGLAERFPGLQCLHVANNPLTDISELKNFDFFYELGLAGLKIDSLEDISHLGRALVLDISGTGISSLSDVAKIGSIDWLIAKDNGITDLAPLQKAGHDLYKVDLTNNKVSSLAPLKDMYNLTKFHFLKMRGNPLGTTVGKNDANCPKDGLSKAVRYWCQQPATKAYAGR